MTRTHDGNGAGDNLLRSKVIAASVILVLVGAGACGGGSSNNEGAAVAAVAQFFVQERDGGRLAEGVQVDGVGVAGSSIRTLAVRAEDKAESIDERYCMEYRYEDPAQRHKEFRRVYVAALIDGAWSVEAVNPDGTCEGVE